jgi:hypothetical protein
LAPFVIQALGVSARMAPGPAGAGRTRDAPVPAGCSVHRAVRSGPKIGADTRFASRCCA